MTDTIVIEEEERRALRVAMALKDTLANSGLDNATMLEIAYGLLALAITKGLNDREGVAAAEFPKALNDATEAIKQYARQYYTSPESLQ